MPDRAGAGFSILEWIWLIIKTLPRALIFYASRATVVDGRLLKVRSLPWFNGYDIGS
jgi:hypothetical protein